MRPLTTFLTRNLSLGFISSTHTSPRHSCPTTRKVVRGKSGKGGFVLIEALVASSILVVVLAGALGALLISLQSASGNGARLEAAYLADEGIEAVRLLRDDGWDANIANLPIAAPLYLAWNGTTWVATSTNTYIDGVFERSVELSDVYRDGGGSIITGSSDLDEGTRKVTVTVSWMADGATSSRSLSAYITDFFNN